MQRPLTLWEIMERFKAKKLAHVIEMLAECRAALARAEASEPVGNPKVTLIEQALSAADEVSIELRLVPLMKDIGHSKDYFTDPERNITNAPAENEIRNLLESIRDGLDSYQFIAIAPGMEKYIEKPLLGNAIYSKFR